MECAYRPGHREGRHEHEHASVYLFLDGSCPERYGPREREYQPSSVVINPAGVFHSVRYGRVGGRIVNVVVPSTRVQRLRVRAPILERVDEIRGGRVEALMREIHGELRRAELATGLAIEGLVCELAAAL